MSTSWNTSASLNLAWRKIRNLGGSLIDSEKNPPSTQIPCPCLFVKFLSTSLFIPSSTFFALKTFVPPRTLFISTSYALITQPILQCWPNPTELRSMNYYHQIFCRFRKCKRKVPPPSPLSNDFEKSFFFKIFSNDFFFANKIFSTI